jgi:cysteine desulfuration protein SufE
LLALAKNHECSENIREDKYLIKGCSTQLWLKPVFVNNNLHFLIDAQIGLISLGLGVLATMLYNGRTVQEMAQIDQNVFIEIGLLNGLSPTRNNGFTSLLKQIDLYIKFYIKLLDKH